MTAVLRRISASYILYILCASTSVLAGTLPTGSFWVGYNEAWFADKYLNWLADNPYFNLTSGFDRTFVDKIFAGIANGNAKIVRIWAFPGLQGIALSTSTQTGDLTTIGLTADFKKNLPKVLSLAKKHGLKVYITALNGNDMRVAVGNKPLQSYYTNLLLNNHGERERFKNNALRPLLEILNEKEPDGSLKYPVYAVDLINEIEAPLNTNYFPNSWLGARDFIQDMTAFVKLNSPWLPVTSSAGFGFALLEIAFGLYSGVGLDFYDLHVYADWGLYLGVTWLCNKVSADGVPVILGEYGQNSRAVDDILQYWTTAIFLYGAKTQCFSAALAWKYETSDAWWTYLRTDGTFRPAYSIIQSYGAFP